MNSPLVIFDLDGTLVDTAPDIIQALNFTIAIKGLAPVNYDDLKHIVGQGGRIAIKRAFALRNEPLTDDVLEPLYDTFIAHYLENIPGESKLYDGLIDSLEELEKAGFGLAVCTNKTEALTKPLLAHLGLDRFFKTVTCGDTFAWRKPDGRHLTSTVELAQGDVTKAIMVGDSINDIAAAKDAGIPSIGVPFGYTDIPMRELEPTVLIETFAELTPELVQKLIDRK